MTKKPSAPADLSATAAGLDISAVDALARIAASNDLSEIEVEHQGLRIRVARHREPAPVQHIYAPAPGVAPALAVAAAAPTPSAAAPPQPSVDEHPGAVKSPMVGTAYLRPSPEAKAFVELGASVKAGDKLLLVEAMKTFNDILAPRAGKVTRILVENGSPVEYDQPLIIIE